MPPFPAWGAPCSGTDSSKEGGTTFRLGVVLAVEGVAAGEQGVFGGVGGGGDDVGVGMGKGFARIAGGEARRRRDRVVSKSGREVKW